MATESDDGNVTWEIEAPRSLTVDVNEDGVVVCAGHGSVVLTIRARCLSDAAEGYRRASDLFAPRVRVAR